MTRSSTGIRALLLSTCLFWAGCVSTPAPQQPHLTTAAAPTPVFEHEWYLPLASGCNLYVHEVGAGPPVVVLHGGWGYEHSYLVDGFRPLADRYRFVFYDQRGSLRSPCDSLASVEGHVADLEQLRTALGEERLNLVGHGIGGYLAMRYATAHPDRVGALSLLAPLPARAADLLSPTQDDLRERFRRPAAIAEFHRNGISTEVSPTEPRSRYLEHKIAKGAVYLHDVRKWQSLRGTMFYNPGASQAAGMPPESEDLTSALAVLPTSIQVIFPDDHYYPVEASTRWVRDVPNAELVIVPRAGYVLWIDRPKCFAAHLGAYLGHVVPRAASAGSVAATSSPRASTSHRAAEAYTNPQVPYCQPLSSGDGS
jgi:proline iminopeptidase